jgi:hypothetical protein
VINVVKPFKQLTAVLLLLLTFPVLYARAQPPGSGESIANLRILHDNSVELSGTWSKPIRPWEIASYLARGIPLSADLTYFGNLSLNRAKDTDKLRGKLIAVIYPRLNPREVRPDVIKEYQAKNLMTKSKIVDLLAVLYGEDMLVYYGIETKLVDVNVTSALYGNFTVTTLRINATVESSAKLVESLNLTFAARRVSEELYVITYFMNLTTSPIQTSREEGYIAIDLEPIVNFFPFDTVTTLKVNLTQSPLQLIKTDPEATLLTPRYAEILFIPIGRNTVMLYLKKVSLSFFVWLSLILSIIVLALALSKKFLKMKAIKLPSLK